MKVTNIDCLSALLDRLVTERIKWHAFVKQDDRGQAAHQEAIIAEIRSRLTALILECVTGNRYDCMAEKRTYATKQFIEELESLVTNNFNLGEADRAKVAAVEALVSHELRARRANEARALNKNSIDRHFKTLIEQTAELPSA